MDSTAKTRAVDDAIAALNRAVSESLSRTMRPVLEQLFDAGQLENMAAIQRAMQYVGPSVPASGPSQGAALGTSSKDGRAPRGAVRRAVIALLKSREPAGATMNEVINSLRQFDPDVSGVSARNELARSKGTLYLQDENGEWHLKAKTPAQMTFDAEKNPQKDRAPEPSTSLTGALDTNQEAEQMPPP